MAWSGLTLSRRLACLEVGACLLWKLRPGGIKSTNARKERLMAHMRLRLRLHVPARGLPTFTYHARESKQTSPHTSPLTPSRRRALPTPGPGSLNLLVSFSSLVKTARNRLIGRQLSIDSFFVDFIQDKVAQFPISPPLDQP